MADRDDQTNLSRRRLLRAAALVPAVTIPAIVVASPAEAAYNGEITRSNVMLRARNWYNRDIPYNGDSRASDYEGSHTYRQDCSGFVSMAWHSPTPGHSTRTLPDISREKPWDNLKQGDILNKAAAYPNGHCMLFEKWHAEIPDAIRAYELTTVGMGMRAHTYTIDWLRSNGYVPRQYHKIVAG
ncbi:hypothetical protein [Glycomyces artemisiae]|uniref:NlpC/P60 family protein n=1 Tax=Glycomyces artemisiae TaxID=1076443 RepID=A0A2T0UXA3_9ACTN|nr:hypothetical protein [Glycomyces artemisiae]PRY62478.1 hypothetical protein B0I28_101812 [Glycomyces artemisiae]